MNLALHPLLAITAGAMLFALAPITPAQSPAHGIEPVIDGTSPLGPLHGYGQGTWIDPDLQEGHLYAKLLDSRGVERFTLNASLTEYLFFVAAPAQGEIHGNLLIPHIMPARGVAYALTEIYATVEGMWIETAHGRGAFVASILRPSDGLEGPLVQIGQIEGTFQLGPVALARRSQLTQESLAPRSLAPQSLANGAKDAGLDSAVNALRHVHPEPPIVVLPGWITPAAHGIQLAPQGTRGPMNDHGGLGEVGQGGAGAGSVAETASGATTVTALRGRASLRWEIFE
jgi:hypothetical protein